MMTIFRLFFYIPFAMFAVTVAAFVFTCRLRVRAQAIWTMVLLACFSKFYCFETFFGNPFYPQVPLAVHWVWGLAFTSASILTLLSVPLCWWRSRTKAVLLPMVACAIAMLGMWNAIKMPEVKEIELRFPDLPAELEGYRIAQVSDIHCSSASPRWRTERLVKLINSVEPDLICLLGDNVDGRSTQLFEDIEPIRNLHARDGVWAVTGNHEYYHDTVGWIDAYRRLGIRFLSNECVFPRRCLALGGVPDFAARRFCGDSPNVSRAFSAATNGEFRVLMQHQPRTAHSNFEARGVDLQLSGHTHGGFMPLFSRLVEHHNLGFLTGIYEFGDRKLVVSNGVGQWAGFQVRFFTPAELIVITLVKGS